MRFGCVLQIAEVASAARLWSALVRSETRWPRGCFSKLILSREKTLLVFLAVISIRHTSVAIRPSDHAISHLKQDWHLWVPSMLLIFSTEMTSHLLDFHLVIDVIFSIGWTNGRPSRAASFPLSLATTLAFADRLGVGESSKLKQSSWWSCRWRGHAGLSPFSRKLFKFARAFAQGLCDNASLRGVLASRFLLIIAL